MLTLLKLKNKSCFDIFFFSKIWTRMDNPMWLYFGGFLFLQNTDGKAVKNIFLEATELLSRVGDSFLLYRKKKKINEEETRKSR